MGRLVHKCSVNQVGNFLLGVDQHSAKWSIDETSLHKHSYSIGGSGAGKSNFLEHRIRKAMHNTKAGCCVLDPHGTLFHALKEYAAQDLSPYLQRRIILIDPSDPETPVVGFNPLLQHSEKEKPSYIIGGAVNSVLRAWGQKDATETPRIQRIMRGLFTFLYERQLTLAEGQHILERALTSKEFRESEFFHHIKDDTVRAEFTALAMMALRERQSQLEGVENRLNPLLAHASVRNMLCVSKGGINFSDVMRQKKIVLVNLHAGTEADEKSMEILGALLVSEITRHARLRRKADAKTSPFLLYMDEFQRFLTHDINSILEEMRKYGLYLQLAHQYMGQLERFDPTMIEGILSNCKNFFVFGGLNDRDAQMVVDNLATALMDPMRVKHLAMGVRNKPVDREVEITETIQSTGKKHSETDKQLSNWTQGERDESSSSEECSQAARSGTSNTKEDSTQDGTERSQGTRSSTGERQGSSRSEGLDNSSRSANEQHSGNEENTSHRDIGGRGNTSKVGNRSTDTITNSSWTRDRDSADPYSSSSEEEGKDHKHVNERVDVNEDIREYMDRWEDETGQSHRWGSKTSSEDSHGRFNRSDTTTSTDSSSERSEGSVSRSLVAHRDATSRSQSEERLQSKTQGTRNAQYSDSSKSQGNEISRADETSETVRKIQKVEQVTEEVEEEKGRTFWALDEQRFLLKRKLITLPVGGMFTVLDKTAGAEPVFLQTPEVFGVESLQAVRRIMGNRLMRQSANGNKLLYQSLADVEQQAIERQQRNFGYVLGHTGGADESSSTLLLGSVEGDDAF